MKKDKSDPNWAEKIILKKTKELIDKKVEEKEYKDGDYYYLNESEFKRLCILSSKESRKIEILQNMLKQTDDIKERLRIADTLEEIVRRFWKDFYIEFPHLNKYHLTLELLDKRIKIVRKKLNEEI